MAPPRKAELCVEVLYKNLPDQPIVPRKTISDKVYQWLTVDSELVGLFLGTCVPMSSALMKTCPNAERIESIRVTDFFGPPETNPYEYQTIENVQLVVHAYELHSTPKQLSPDKRASLHGSNEGSGKPMVMPNRDLAGTWDSLVFRGFDPSQLLKSITRTIVLLKQPGIDLNAVSLNRLILLYGPPGCGKTTLCRALAQKLTIRLGGYFASSQLFEINTQALSSKYYSESAKLVEQVFRKLLAVAKDETGLVCLLIDEIETIAASRDQLTQTGECYDSIRATNQLLTALDRIRHQSNVIVLCTSNLHQAIDSAFLDRVDYEVEIPAPSKAAIYEILRSTMNELIRSKIISNEPYQYPEDVAALIDDHIYIPGYNRLQCLDKHPDSPASILAGIAESCVDFSGRRLRKLPLLAITTYAWGDSCSLKDALEALQMAVKEEMGRKDALKDMRMTAEDGMGRNNV